MTFKNDVALMTSYVVLTFEVVKSISWALQQVMLPN